MNSEILDVKENPNCHFYNKFFRYISCHCNRWSRTDDCKEKRVFTLAGCSVLY